MAVKPTKFTLEVSCINFLIPMLRPCCTLPQESDRFSTLPNKLNSNCPMPDGRRHGQLMRNSSRIPTTCSCGGDVHITPAELQQLKCSWQPSALSCIVLIWQVGKSKCRNIVSGKGASSTRSEPPKKSHRTRVPLLMVMSSLLFLLPILPSAVSSGPAKQLRLLQSQSPRC